MPYCQVALNVPLDTLLTDRADRIPAPGVHVAVPFRGKTVAGIVWGACEEPEISSDKIRPLAQVFEHEPPLSAAWRELIEFTARYYHYPIGQTAFTALPAYAKPSPVRCHSRKPFFRLPIWGGSSHPRHRTTDAKPRCGRRCWPAQ